MGLSNYLPSSRISQSGVCTSSTRPASPYEGQMIYETDTNRVLVYDNAAWVMIADTDQPPGLQLIKTQTITGSSSSVTVVDAFNSNYDSYRVVIRDGTSTGTANGRLQLTGLNTGYYGNLVYANFLSGTPASVGWNNATEISHAFGTDSDSIYCDFYVIDPFLASRTLVHGVWIDGNNGGSFRAVQRSNTSTSGFTLTANSGNLTGGTIRVYGYRNS